MTRLEVYPAEVNTGFRTLRILRGGGCPSFPTIPYVLYFAAQYKYNYIQYYTRPSSRLVNPFGANILR